MTADEKNEPLHLSKSVSVGHIISTIVFGTMLITSWGNMDKKIAVLEARFSLHQSAQVVQEKKQDSANREILKEIKEMRKDLAKAVFSK